MHHLPAQHRLQEFSQVRGRLLPLYWFAVRELLELGTCMGGAPLTTFVHFATVQACPANQYALPGDTVCRNRIACSTDDYYQARPSFLPGTLVGPEWLLGRHQLTGEAGQVFTGCVAGQRLREWRPTQPRICQGDAAGLQNR